MNIKTLKLKFHLLGLGMTLLVAPATLRAAEPTDKLTAPDVKVEFTEKGELSLTLDGTLISQPNTPLNKFVPEFACYVKFRDPSATVPLWGGNKNLPQVKSDLIPKTTRFDAAARQLTQTFDWGEVVRTYRPVPGGVDIEVTVHNTSPKTLCEFQQNLFALKLPGDTGPAFTTEAMYFGQAAPAAIGDTLSGPVALPLVNSKNDKGNFLRAVVATTPETKRHLQLSWETDTWVEPWNREAKAKKRLTGYAVNDPVAMDLALRQMEEESAEKGENWWLTLRVGGDRLLYHDRYTSRPIPPGGNDTYTVWLRFGDAADPLAPAKEALEAYGKSHPMLVKWEDRRPIVPTMIGDKFPFHEPEGLELKKPVVGPRAEEVRKLMLDHADALIAQMKKLNAQGMIVWNIEGNGPPQIKYVGDPHMIEYMCPEADAVADEFFKKFRDAGFKVGVCLRPSVIEVGELAKNPWLKGQNPNATTPYAFFHNYPHKTRSPADILSEKVAYAKKRWGCTLFYVDTNHAAGFTPQTEEEKAAWPKDSNGDLKWYNEILNEDVWAEVLKRHPDVLFTIEHTPLIQYTINAPFDDGLAGLGGTPPVVRATWPEAFKCIAGTGGQSPGSFWKWVERATKGDIILGGGPYDMAEFLTAVFTVVDYQKAGLPPEAASMDQGQLLAAALDMKADGRLRFHAAKKLCDGQPDPATIEKLLVANDQLVQMLAIDSLKSRDQLNAQLPRLVKLPTGQHGFLAAPLSEATKRGGPGFLEDLTNYARSNPVDAGAVVNMINITPGPDATERLAEFVADTGQPDQLRNTAVSQLGWRKNGTAAQKDAALAYLLPRLGDAKTRAHAAGILHPRYVWNHGLWHKDPRVLEAAKTAMGDEQAQPQPDEACLAVLEKIVKSQQ
jgi:hypothetical protein